jgi:DNA adenine methylase
MSNPIRYFGGKQYLAKKFIALFPPHTRYCESHFGGGAVLFAKSPDNCAEFINDIDASLTNFWRVLRDDAAFCQFQRIVNFIPLSQTEFRYACEDDAPWVSPCVISAISFFVRFRQSRQGLGKDFCTPTSRLRRGMNENVSAWLSAVDGLPDAHERLRRVEIRCQDAVEFIKQLDSPDTFHYCDPPYCHETRSTKDAYTHEMTPEQHQELLITLASIKGKFMLSGYPSEMYDSFTKEHNWHVTDFKVDNKASSAKEKEIKTERIWTNYETNTSI